MAQMEANERAKTEKYIREFNQQHMAQKDKVSTDIYGYFEGEINAGSPEPAEPYSHHSKEWNDKVNAQAYALEQQLADSPDEEGTLATADVNHKTVDFDELYDKMAVQTGYSHPYAHHSKFYQQQVNKATADLEQELALADKAGSEDWSMK